MHKFDLIRTRVLRIRVIATAGTDAKLDTAVTTQPLAQHPLPKPNPLVCPARPHVHVYMCVRMCLCVGIPPNHLSNPAVTACLRQMKLGAVAAVNRKVCALIF